VVVSEKEGRAYDGILEGGLIFSPDSKHIAYAAMDGNGTFVVRDDNQEDRYDGLSGIIVFSPDGTHVAYHASIGTQRFEG
jgi:roadblock/LC7 domain-containing protein